MPQRKHTHSTINSLMTSIKKGSGTYRKIISRSQKQSDVHNPSRWRVKLNDDQVTRHQVKQSRINLQSKYISSDTADILARLKLGKTLFRNQLYTINFTDTPFCETCRKELDQEVTENFTHANFYCPFVSTIIDQITSTFFPNIINNFPIRDIIIATITNNHPLYEGTDGQQLASIIWDTFLSYITRCRNTAKTPVATICIHEITSQLNRILKILPHSKVACHISTHPQIQDILSKNTKQNSNRSHNFHLDTAHLNPVPFPGF